MANADVETVPTIDDPAAATGLSPLAGEHTNSWFSHAGLGLFIHYDHASQQGLETSWPLLGGDAGTGSTTPVEDYHRSAATFDPEHWDPADLANHASAAGMQYAVFTARHHSGWSSWPSKVSDRTIASSPYGQSKVSDRSIASSPYGQRGGDLVREYVNAFRSAGLKVGIYYSLSDWGHPQYPAFTDDMRPYQAGSYPRPTADDWARYRQYLKDQLTELLTWYGPIDLLWFDGEWERTAAEWDSAGLERHIRALAANIVINDRLPDHGDYKTPEQFIPAQALAEPWECCMTMCDNWSYVPEDRNYKSLHEILRTLAEVTAKGGNLLLNIGPRGDGSLAPEQAELLRGLGGWMDVNKEAVIGVSAGLEPWQYYGPSTSTGDTTYLFALAEPVETVTVRGIKVRRVTSVRQLGSSTGLPFSFRTAMNDRQISDPDGELNIEVRNLEDAGVVRVFGVEMGAEAS